MVQSAIAPAVLYPDSDGKPMSENTLQYRWIVRIVTNLKRLLKDQTAFVAGDLLWYPVQVEEPPAPCQAPDAMVVFGRPAGDRDSYKQWEEGDIAPQVVFEILSPSNTVREMLAKQAFYGQYGVLEMYFYDPESYDFYGMVRQSATDSFAAITPINCPWTSPLLGIRFEMYADGLAIFHPDGELFKEPDEYIAERDQALQERDQALQERDRALQERDRAFTKLRELGIDPAQL